jgi:hypothetical protein
VCEPDGELAFYDFPQEQWNLQVLLSADVLVLDLDFPRAGQAAADSRFAGLDFLKKHRERLANQFVYIYTRYETRDLVSVELPLLTREHQDPVIGVYNKDKPADVNYLVSRIANDYTTYVEGYTRLSQSGVIQQAAHHDLPILIVGPTGAGKEALARRIHRQWRSVKIGAETTPSGVNYDMVSYNCAGWADEKIARAELFGHVRGAYTGAERPFAGALLQASMGSFPKTVENTRYGPQQEFKTMLTGTKKVECGEDGKTLYVKLGAHPTATVFLDEIADLSPLVQSMLLRYLENWEVMPVKYAGIVRNVRVRIIAATSNPLIGAWATDELHAENWAEAGRSVLPLRPDLFFRIKGQVIRAEGITLENAERVVRRLVEENKDSNKAVAVGCTEWLGWEDSAVEYLVDIVKNRINRAATHTGRVDFGHHREVTRLIQLVNAYVGSMRERGLRRERQKEVLVDDVKKVCRPGKTDASVAPPKAAHHLMEEQIFGSESRADVLHKSPKAASIPKILDGLGDGVREQIISVLLNRLAEALSQGKRYAIVERLEFGRRPSVNTQLSRRELKRTRDELFEQGFLLEKISKRPTKLRIEVRPGWQDPELPVSSREF